MKNVTKTNKIILTLVVGMSFFISACGETPSEVQSPLVGTVEKMKPIAKALALNMLEDSSATGQLAGEAKEQGTLSFEIVSLPAHGSIANFDSNLGSFDYLPNANFNGSDSLQFIAKEGDLKSEVTLLPIVITPVNDAPIAASMPFSLNEDVRT